MALLALAASACGTGDDVGSSGAGEGNGHLVYAEHLPPLLDVGDPAGYLDADYTCGGSYNIAHYCNEETDAQVNQALQDPDQDARYEIYRDLAQKLQSEAVNIFLVHESGVVGTTTHVENYQAHPLNFYVRPKNSASAEAGKV